MMILALVIFFFIYSGVAAAEVAIIAHPSVQADSLDKKLLNSVYRCEVRSWDDGTKIKVWDLGERGETKETFYDYIGIRPSRMKSLWMKQLLTGEGEPPDEVKTQDDMIKKVMATPGSIGYVDKEMVGSGVKLLLLIDKKELKKPDK
ncbi:MAG TPA: hypothetical protein VHP63_06545 [candidate division Zixibacteria bacterium]|nr:hypothetical protein [candidate division Zixibacteria bacterium]